MDIVIQILTILLLGVTVVFALIPLVFISFAFWILFVDIRDCKAPKKGRCE